jgi:hypothetical protein
MPAERRSVLLAVTAMALVVAIIAVQRRARPPSATESDGDRPPWPTADVAVPFPADSPELRYATQACTNLSMFVSEEVMFADRLERLSLAHAQRVWDFVPQDVGDAASELSPTENFLAAVLADGAIVSTAEMALDDDGSVYCVTNWEPELADELAAIEPDDKLVRVWLHPAFGEDYYRLHDGTMIPLNDEAQRTIHGVQPYDAFRSIIAQLAPCFPDDCGDIDIPTPMAMVPTRAARTATPFPTDIPASLVSVTSARVEEFSPTWQVGDVTRMTAGRFVVVDVVVQNGSRETYALPSVPTIQTADHASYTALGDVDGLLPSGPECVLAPITAGGDLRCTLAFELPAGAQNPVLAYGWVDANGSGSTLQQLRLPSDGYPAPTP